LETPATRLPEGTAYGVAVGNHDQSPFGDAAGSTEFYNQYFGEAHFLSRGYYGGHFGTNNDNHFDLFEAGGMKFIVLYLEYDQLTTDTNAAVFEWAKGLLNTHRNRRAIVVSHYLMNPGINAAFSPQGQAVYSALKGHTNLFLMLCGHVDPPEGRRSDTFNGNTVWTAQSDYQGLANGGNGWLRLYEFSPKNNRIRVQTFSPWLNQFEFVNTSQFDIPYQMASLEPFRVIGSFTGVRSGDSVSVPWTNLLTGTEYEWQVTISDGTNTVLSPQWRFVTTTNSPPFASNQLVRVRHDMARPINLHASDPEGAPLTYQLVTQPTHGLIKAFEAYEGRLIYKAAHRYTGPDTFSFRVFDGLMFSEPAVVELAAFDPPGILPNGVQQSWMRVHRLTEADADEDRDGFSNSAEYAAHTDPRSAQSRLRILSAGLDELGRFRMTWASVGGVRYRVNCAEIGTGFSGTFWPITRTASEEIDPAADGATSTQTFTDARSMASSGNSTKPTARLYRIEVVP